MKGAREEAREERGMGSSVRLTCITRARGPTTRDPLALAIHSPHTASPAARRSRRLAAEAARIGFPLLVKAVSGGGGKGMKLAATAEAFAEALRCGLVHSS
jgi:biotin carboxylase